MSNQRVTKNTIVDAIDPKIQAAVLAGLRSYNNKHAPGKGLDFSIGIKLRTKVIGGAIGSSVWDWLFVKLLWVDTRHRSKGIGSQVMSEVEALAIKRGCIGIHLDTFSFQARGFYEKLGFQVFGTIKDHPIGHQRFYLSKRID